MITKHIDQVEKEQILAIKKKSKLSAFDLSFVIKNNPTINSFETALRYQLLNSFQSVLVHLGLETDTYQYLIFSNIFVI